MVGGQYFSHAQKKFTKRI